MNIENKLTDEIISILHKQYDTEETTHNLYTLINEVSYKFHEWMLETDSFPTAFGYDQLFQYFINNIYNK